MSNNESSSGTGSASPSLHRSQCCEQLSKVKEVLATMEEEVSCDVMNNYIFLYPDGFGALVT